MPSRTMSERPSKMEGGGCNKRLCHFQQTNKPTFTKICSYLRPIYTCQSTTAITCTQLLNINIFSHLDIYRLPLKHRGFVLLQISLKPEGCPLPRISPSIQGCPSPKSARIPPNPPGSPQSPEASRIFPNIRGCTLPKSGFKV